MQQKTLLFFLSFWFFLQSGMAQECGLTQQDIQLMLERLDRNKATLQAFPRTAQKSNEIVYIPVTFHLVAKANGSGRINEKLVLEQLCALNEDFEPVGFRFYLKDTKFSYVNNNVIYDQPFNAESGIMQIARDNNAVNIWLVNNANQEDGTVGVTRGYYRAFFDWIVLDKSFVSKNEIGMPHEMAHFFSLAHPFLGWDSEPYDPSKHGDPAPVRSPGGQFTELMDGSNCETAGDRVCDTPPDYNFGFGASNCNYTGGAKDPKGVLVDPEEANFVGYFLNCNREEYHFTPQQIALMQADYFEGENRNYLRRNATPPTTEVITELPDLVLPEDQAVVSNNSPIRLEWTAPAGATHYLLEVGLVPTFSIKPQRYIVQGTSFNLDGNLLDFGRRYYWRVMPFNAYSTCSPSTALHTFTIGETTAVQDIPEIESFTVMPNPAPKGQQFQLMAEVKENFEAQAALFNTSGQIVQTLGQLNFIQGSNTIEISTANLSPGIYMLSLQSQKGRSIRRIVIF